QEEGVVLGQLDGRLGEVGVLGCFGGGCRQLGGLVGGVGDGDEVGGDVSGGEGEGLGADVRALRRLGRGFWLGLGPGRGGEHGRHQEGGSPSSENRPAHVP